MKIYFPQILQLRDLDSRGKLLENLQTDDGIEPDNENFMIIQDQNSTCNFNFLPWDDIEGVKAVVTDTGEDTIGMDNGDDTDDDVIRDIERIQQALYSLSNIDTADDFTELFDKI